MAQWDTAASRDLEHLQPNVIGCNLIFLMIYLFINRIDWINYDGKTTKNQSPTKMNSAENGKRKSIRHS